MTSSPAFQHLCCELVEDHYGDFYRLIFEALAYGGRLTAPQIAQKCHLPLRQAKSGLAGLIQVRLIHHHTPKDTQAVYSANLNKVYDIVRIGRLVEAAKEYHGETAGDVVAIACGLGFATVSELRDRVLANSDYADARESAASIDQLVDDLLDDHFLILLRKAHFSEAHDTRREVELGLLSPAAIAKLTGTKAKLEHAHNIERGYEDLTQTSKAERGHINDGFLQQIRQGARNGVNGVVQNGHSAHLATLVQPNLHKVVTLSQSRLVEDLAKNIHGAKAARVLACAVRPTSDPDVWSKLPASHDHELTARKIAEDVNAERRRHDRQQATSRVNGHSQDNDDDMVAGDVDRELMFLAESTFPFLKGSPHMWQLEKGTFDDWIRKEETLRVMESRLDHPAPRILRILIDKGKLEERTLQEIGLLAAKDLRQSLSVLKQMGYLDLQEVPRNPQRMPNQTVFLWSHEADRVRNLVLEGIYATMKRMIQLLKLERDQIESTLAKLEREDVKGHEEEMLPTAEYAVLSRFWKTEGWVWSEIHRLDSTVAILRDT